jgi:NADPH-dependent glutamate synthase beta subunit-like oxidoreductase
VAILRDQEKVTGLKCMRMALGEPDASGRPRPVPVSGSEFDVEATAVIAAISQEPDFSGFTELRCGKDWIRTDEWGGTSVDGVYAGGDDVELGLASIAIAHGRLAAEAIEGRLRGGQKPEKPEPPATIPPERVKLAWYKEAPRHERGRISADRRALDVEIEAGLSGAEALDEAKRCLSCGMCMDCETCWIYCTPSAFV